jgi:tRNA(Arg) A34 adenosine deaminase TadA
MDVLKLNDVKFALPLWVSEFITGAGTKFDSIEMRMTFVIELARRNIINGTGGPFGAAVFESDGTLIAPGVNIVVPSNCSILHAEMVALALAQQRTGSFDLSCGGTLCRELVASTEPCAMCFGAVPWSGVHRLVCGARDEDARAAGFDEGPKLPNWPEELEKRGIDVQCDLLRDDAAAVLREYAASGAPIYNPGG